MVNVVLDRILTSKIYNPHASVLCLPTNKAKRIILIQPNFDHIFDYESYKKYKKYNLSSESFLKTLGLQLVGPYDILAGKHKKSSKKGGAPCWLRHWRYYYDPPEFMTVIRGDDKTLFHMGYFRWVN